MISMETPHREPRLLNAVCFAVNRNGEIVVRADGEAELVVTIKDDGDPSHLELRRGASSVYLHVPLFATCFLHCNSVRVAVVVRRSRSKRSTSNPCSRCSTSMAGWHVGRLRNRPCISCAAAAALIIALLCGASAALAQEAPSHVGPDSLYAAPTFTPGTVFGNLTADQVCVPGCASSVGDVTRGERAQVYAEYGTADVPGMDEIDHLLS
jgi:hypothetical protein